ncbi:MAG: beta-eliminating lyase-related protein [Oscillibacter sp.]|jgi:threonine aldolase|nr:beta-eliminating lyase-related protein [Oscillibacter sp.]
MYSFRNDYSEGAHPSILRALGESNLEQTCGYGLDPCCREAAGIIREKCGVKDADVHFVVGGTQANLLVIQAFLRPFEAVIAAETGHVNVHETGAIEATGHKVCTVPTPDGKLTPALIERVIAGHSSEHMVAPRLVYVSETTELGTFYTVRELREIRSCCDAHQLYLYVDGARLGSALTTPGSDLTFPALAAAADAFTIGGTKNGALFGEAIVLVSDAAKPNFRWYIKQRGAMLAKGRLLGIQFRELLRGDLYLELARHANEMAAIARERLTAKGYRFAVDSRSNQLFPIVQDDVIRALCRQYEFDVNEKTDPLHSVIRLVTSWATPEEAVRAFVRDLPAADSGC